MKHQIVLGLGAFLPLVACANKPAEKTPTEKPNILFICIDDLRAQLGAYGHDYMITPNLDKLAGESRLFNRHFVQVPTSGPSRCCMLTGQNVKEIAHIKHHHLRETLAGTPEPEHPETFVHYLKQNGYYTLGMGKVSHSDIGCKGKEIPHSWNEFVLDPNSPWKNVGLLHAYGNGEGREKGNPKPAYQNLDVEDEGYPDGRMANMATAQLERLAKKKQPFFMAVGFYKPHLPFCAPKKYWDMYDHDKIALSPNPDLPEGVSPVFLHDSKEFFEQYSHPEYGAAGKRLSDEYARKVIHANYAAITYTDAQVGKVMRKLKELGLDKNTIVVVWGDHGWHLGDHTIWGKHSTFERALNSTLMVKTPDMKQKGVPTDGLVASVDIYPTLCDLVGLPAPSGLDGQSFTQLLDNPSNKGKDAVMSYWRNILSMRTDEYRMAVFNNGQKQEVMLFDHDTDPNETKNIAKDNPIVVEHLMKKVKQLNKGFLPNL